MKRIDDKAQQEGISNKHACRKLGLHEWKYYTYKNDIKHDTLKQQRPELDHEPAMTEVSISITLTKQAYDYLKAEASDFALEPAIVAQMMLHHAIMKASREKNGNKEVIP